MSLMFVQILKAIVLPVFSLGAIWYAFSRIAKSTNIITLTETTSKFVSLCVVAAIYYTTTETIDSFAFLFIDIEEHHYLLKLSKGIINLGFMIVFFLLAYKVWGNRKKEADSIASANPSILISIIILVLVHIVLMFI